MASETSEDAKVSGTPEAGTAAPSGGAAPGEAGKDGSGGAAPGDGTDALAALDLARGDLNDDDLDELEDALDAVDFAARKATPERLARLRAQHARLGDLIEQIEKGIRKRAADREPLKPEEEERYKQLVEDGVTLGETGKYKEALEKLEAAARIDPDGKEVLLNLGVLYGILAHKTMVKGELYDRHVTDEVFAEKAVFCYERVLELDPEYVHALNNLATLHAIRDERDQAIEALKKSLEILKDQPEVRRHLEELEGTT